MCQVSQSADDDVISPPLP